MRRSLKNKGSIFKKAFHTPTRRDKPCQKDKNIEQLIASGF
ncbi:hypothetical protein VN0768_15440 [Helicobacter pylori]